LRKHVGGDADAHEQYMQALLLADTIIPISNLAANDLIAFFVQHQEADTVPLIKKIPLPAEVRNVESRWSDYCRRVRGLLTDAADESRHLSTLYYCVDLAEPSGAARIVFAQRLARALTERGIALIPVVWDTENKRLIAAETKYLSQCTHSLGPSSWAEWIEPGRTNSPRWVFHPDCTRGELLKEVAAFAKTQRLRTAAILHESIDHGDGVNSAAFSVRDRIHFEALVGIDKVFAVSEHRFREFYRFLLSWRGKVHSAEHRFKTLVSPNEILGQQRRTTPKLSAAGDIHILIFVAPVDRPADLAVMLDAAAKATERSANRLIFTLTGSPSSTPASQWKSLRAKFDSIPNARWEKETDGEQLNQLFDEADFAIFSGFEGQVASSVLGSLWRGLPCLVHVGVAALSANHGLGVAFVDMGNESELTEAILKLTEHEWRRCLSNEAIARTVHSWDDYAKEIATEIATDHVTDDLHPVGMQVGGDVYTALINLRRRPKLSLCISTYNRAGWLEVSLRNIFTQIPVSRDDLEVLAVDNASVDNTPEIVKPYLSRSDFRFVRNQKNVGMLGNLAVTAQRAKGEYVWILGDDDLTRPGVIERVLQIIDQHPGIGLIYLNYGYSSEQNPANVGDLASFLANYNELEPPGPDEFAPVRRLAAKCENFFSAIYSHVYRRDHALKSYCQNTDGRVFSTMLACIPTTHYVLNYMAEELAYWIGEPSLVVNSNVSWTDYGTLLELEHLPHAWDLAERMGSDAGEVDRRRANRLWLVEMMWKEIFENDRAGNSAYFSASRCLMRLKHLNELDKHIPEFMAIYERARKAGHPAAVMTTEELFGAFNRTPTEASAIEKPEDVGRTKGTRSDRESL
jgi:glycosyltransferase involved in cell wall biosynthesis